MKICSTCREEFADKFSFCPVDGTPLNELAASIVASPPPELAALTDADEVVIASSFIADEEYRITMLDDAGLMSRLFGELKSVAHESELTWPEFKRDPAGFVKRSVTSYFQLLKRFFAQPGVSTAMIVAVAAMIVLMAGVILLERVQSTGATRVTMLLFALLMIGMLFAIFASWFSRDRAASLSEQTSASAQTLAAARAADSQSAVAGMVAAFAFVFLVVGGIAAWTLLARRGGDELADKRRDDIELQMLTNIPPDQPEPEKEGPAGMNKGTGGGSKPEQEKPQGGGGGGRLDQRPASVGKLPQASLDVPQVLAPDPDPPKIKNPSLPTPATIKADPLLFPTDTRPIAYGDPKSTSTETSAGPGTGNGIGTGEGGGVGSGRGGGVGPGEDGNTGGGRFRPGGGGPGGGGDGLDINRIFSGREVTQKARILSKPEPQYTEEARKNQISGTVVLRAVFSSNGSVTNIRTVSGLPYGLTEKAISAARLIRFTPAMKEGHAVSQYIQIEYNFNLY